MTLTEFKKRLKAAACFCRDFTDKHIQESLPKKICFKLESQDLFTLDQVVEKLSAPNGFPVWINLYVNTFDQDKTIIQITYSADNSKNESDFYHQHEGLPPFHIVGPTAPEGWRSLEQDSAFPFIRFS